MFTSDVEVITGAQTCDNGGVTDHEILFTVNFSINVFSLERRFGKNIGIKPVSVLALNTRHPVITLPAIPEDVIL